MLDEVNTGFDAEFSSFRRCRVSTTDVAFKVDDAELTDCHATVDSGTGVEGENLMLVDCSVRAEGQTVVSGDDIDNSTAIGCSAHLFAAGTGFDFLGLGSLRGCSVFGDPFAINGSVRGYVGSGHLTGCHAQSVELGFDIDDGLVKGCSAINSILAAGLSPGVTDIDNDF